MAASPLDKEQDRSATPRSGVDDAQMYGGIGLDLYPDPIRIKLAHRCFIGICLAAGHGRKEGDLVPILEFGVQSIWQV